MIKLNVNVLTEEKGFQRLMKEVKKLAKKPYVSVGVQGSDASKERGKVSLADIATYNEFGTETIPERSFIRATIDENREELIAYSSELQDQIMALEISTEKALGLLGQKITALIKAKFTNNDWAPNAPSTIKRKGSSMPLIDTGQLRNSITYKRNME